MKTISLSKLIQSPELKKVGTKGFEKVSSKIEFDGKSVYLGFPFKTVIEKNRLKVRSKLPQLTKMLYFSRLIGSDFTLEKEIVPITTIYNFSLELQKELSRSETNGVIPFVHANYKMLLKTGFIKNAFKRIC